MHTKLAYKFLLITAFLLFACQLTGTATTATPGGQLPPTSVAPGAPTTEPYTFASGENGISLHYPKGWITQAADPSDTQNLIIFVSPDSSIMSYLYVFPAQSGETLEAASASLRQEVTNGLSSLTSVVNEGTSLDDGTPAWTTMDTALRSDASEITINLTLAVYGIREYALLTFGLSDDYMFHINDITSLTHAWTFQTPTLYNNISRDQALVLLGYESTNPRDYDPATTHGSGDKLVFSGLVAFDTQLNLLPDLAESWDVSADGKIYTFRLRTNARFHDGRSVTAQDVIYSWEHAADPNTNSDTVLTYLGDIVGVKEMNEGKADHISGLSSVDDHTLQVTIDAPKPYFLLKLTYPTAFVIDRNNVESGSEWYRTPNGTGPYRLTRWDRFKVMIYERNTDFYLGAPVIPYVVVQLFSGVGIRLYETGEIDLTSVYSSDVSRVLDPEEPLHKDLVTGVDLCTGYVVFDTSQPPFDDAKVRQAFSLAFDREKYIEVVLNGIGLPAIGVFPPGLPGFNLDLQGLPFDAARARQMLAESKYGGPQGLPPIVYSDSGIGNDAGASVAAMAQMWEQNLGVSITVENLDPDKYYDLLYSGVHGQMFDGGWCADYPDPENFADVLFHTGNQQNLGKYSNTDIDTLLDQARIEQDVTRRIAFYQQAEQMIVDDAAVLFTTHSLSYTLVKPYIKGFVFTPINIPLERYLWLDWSK